MTRQRIDPRQAAALWIALIYLSIPLVRRVREAFTAQWPAELIGVGVIVTVVGALVISVLQLRRRQLRFRTIDTVWLIAVALVAVVWTSRLMGQPEEAVHFVEYGVLGVLLYRALADRLPDPTVYVAATLSGLLVGTVDELIQWLAPGRFWDFRDIVLNGGAVALVQIAVWRLDERPPHRVRATSVLVVCRLAASLVLLLTLCFAATPRRLHRLADHLPIPQRLFIGSDAICEYGFRHAIDDLTIFRSRLSLDRLVELDQSRAHVVAAELDASRGGGLAREGPSLVDDPFAYEARVHLFARNRNLHRARSREAGSADHRRLMTTAWRQNLILETIFANTLEQSSYGWGPRVRAEVEDAQDPEVFFDSRVAAHLITRLSEGQLRGLMLMLFAALVACDIALSKQSRPEASPV
jgi:hypothetical protein